ncbi:MAG: lysophospholipid acyltransferase family protein [Gemmatimonadaceae bacterium]|jgi:KDO2-lipid IV(A) lauroyltransferase|nr:lysophospholipid acyltransferase family protein [Gemmatimonadaceae bacterium]
MAEAARAPGAWDRWQLAAFRLVVRVLRGLPVTTASRIGAFIGRLGWWPLGIRRTVVERQVGACFPELDATQRRDVCRGAYASLGRTSVETALLAELDAAATIAMFREVRGFEHIEAGLAAGRGIILVSGHHGNWELGGAYLAARGVPVDAVFFPPANPAFHRYLVEARQRIGMRVVTVAESARVVPRALRDGRAVALMADQALFNISAAPVTFFGRPAFAPRGPAVFALRAGAPVLYCAILRRPDGHFTFDIDPIPYEATGDKDGDVDRLVQAITARIEQWVRREPAQYFWHHKRWKRQPEGTPAALGDPVRMAVAGR